MCVSLLQEWALLNKLGGCWRMSCPADTNPLHSGLTHTPGWCAHKGSLFWTQLRLLPHMPLLLRSLLDWSALWQVDLDQWHMPGHSHSHSHSHGLGMAESSGGPDRVMEPDRHRIGYLLEQCFSKSGALVVHEVSRNNSHFKILNVNI